ncbi:hypothetical protein L1280_000446 [Deinococcus sp. HSC-46F16]|uniref:hypothetical protein n=1 Tax=Deinococcus sp. HSC-46F16 TaxID=2910968 RepID=UPI00209D2544|nr:hypothetical protein [Deinococcus sp. HSC-46F16]MCP2013318.1 hypothetical protein [Deinococcus sp. HSC-46F16]
MPPSPLQGQDTPGLPNDLRVRAQGDEVWIGPALHLRVWDGGTEITVASDGRDVPEAAWTLALAEAHRAGGWLALHAAVLTPAPGQEERGVALSGPSGAGKSTAALRWAHAGGRLAAEDQSWVWPETGRAVGLDRWLRSSEEGVRRFAPEWLARAEGLDAYGKLRLPLTSPGAEVPLAALLVFGLPPQPSAPERVRALWEATGVPLSALGRRRGAAGVAALLERLPIRGVTRENVLEATRQALQPLSLPES